MREFETLDAEHVDAAVEAAHEALLAWRLTPIAERAAIVRRARALMLERAAALAGLLTLEMGKLIGESQWEVGLAASILTYYGEQGPQFARERPLDMKDGSAVIISAPLGVLLGWSRGTSRSTRSRATPARTSCSATPSCSSTPRSARSRR